MTTLTSKIPGVDIWAYDFSRRPVTTLDNNGNPQVIGLNKTDPNGEVVYPVTQKPTEFLDKPYNVFRLICDMHHALNGSKIQSHGIIATGTTAIDEQLDSFDYYSSLLYDNYKFAGDDVYISATATVTRNMSYNSFSTKTPGIKILYQTGIVPHSRGRSVIVFEIEPGYKISSGSDITINPTTQNYFNGQVINGTPKTFTLAYDVTPGIYMITAYSDEKHDWINADIDFATVQTATTPKPTPTPTPAPVTTIPLVQKLTNVTSDITGGSIDRKLNAINLTADSGNTFQTNIQVLFYSGNKVVSDYNIDGNNKDTITIPLNTTPDNTITDSMDDMRLIATATPVNSSVGYEHNYLITDTELSSLSSTVMWDATSDGTEVYDISQFISNIVELPFVVNTTTTVNPISLGKKHSSVVSHEAKNRFLSLDLGTIKVPAKYNNGYDYQNRSIKLYTPFVPPITIDNDNAIEKNIHIIYKIDISNGNLTVNLYNDDILFFTGINNIANQIPFLNRVKNTIIRQDTHFNDNDIRQPYILITREQPILNSDYYPTNERGLIKEYNGSIQVRLLNNMNIPYNELSELTRQMESGVKYVKSNWRIKQPRVN